VEAVVSDHAQRQRVIVGNQPLAGYGRRHRNQQPFGKIGDGLRRLGVIGPAAGDDHRSPGADQIVRRFLQFPACAPRTVGGIGGTFGLGIQIDTVIRQFPRHDLFRKSQMNGPGEAGSGDSKGAPNDLGNLGHTFEDSGPLGDGIEEFLAIQFGNGLLAFTGQRDVGGDQNDRYGGGIRFGNARNRIQRSGAAGTLAKPRFVRQPGVSIGHERGRPLVPGKDVPDGRKGAVKGFIERKAGVAGNAEYPFHAVRLQHFDQNLSAVHTVSLPKIVEIGTDFV